MVKSYYSEDQAEACEGVLLSLLLIHSLVSSLPVLAMIVNQNQYCSLGGMADINVIIKDLKMHDAAVMGPILFLFNLSIWSWQKPDGS